MKIIVKSKFKKDIKSFDQNIFDKVFSIIEVCEKNTFLELKNFLDIKKLKWYSNFFRIRIWDFRIWVKLDWEDLFFLRIKRRKDIYKIFP